MAQVRRAGRPRRSISQGRALGAVTASRRILRSASTHQITGRAAEAAFFAALALLPAVLTLVAVLRLERPAFGGDATHRASAELARLLHIILTPRGAAAADSADALLSKPNGGQLGAGTAIAVLILARGMRSIQRGLADIAGRPSRSTRREWLRAIALAIATVAVGSLLLAAFTLGPLLGHSRQLGGGGAKASALRTVWLWARWPISVLIIIAFATLLLAQERARLDRRRHSLPGATATVIGWLAATALLPLYVTIAARINPTLGSLGGGLILLVWLYLLTLSLFVGAEINAVRRSSIGSAAL